MTEFFLLVKPFLYNKETLFLVGSTERCCKLVDTFKQMQLTFLDSSGNRHLKILNSIIVTRLDGCIERSAFFY